MTFSAKGIENEAAFHRPHYVGKGLPVISSQAIGRDDVPGAAMQGSEVDIDVRSQQNVFAYLGLTPRLY